MDGKQGNNMEDALAITNYKNNTNYTPPRGATWMQDSSKHLGPLKLNQACLLGSHDSATAAISRHSSFGADVSSKVGFWHYLPFAHSIAAEWAKTQKLFIFDQLASGIRYFDFRICQTKEKELYTSHALLGRPIRYVIEAIRSFSLAHPQEIIFLDFNHFYAMDKQDHQLLTEILQQAFKGKLLPAASGLDVKYQDLWQTEYRIIIFYHHQPTSREHDFLWDGSNLYSIWPDVLHYRSLRKFLEHSIVDADKNKFIVRQCILSPSFWQVFRSLLTFTMLPASLSLLARRVNKKIIHWLNQLPLKKRKAIGVVMIDWCTEHVCQQFLTFTQETNRMLAEEEKNKPHHIPAANYDILPEDDNNP